MKEIVNELICSNIQAEEKNKMEMCIEGMLESAMFDILY